MKYESRAAYLRQLLLRSLSASDLDAELSYDRIMQASSTLIEYWQLTRKAEYDRALELNPAERTRRKEINDDNKASNLLQRSIKNQLSPDELAQFQRNLDQVLAYYPVFLNCDDNGAIVGDEIRKRRINFLDGAQLEALILDLISDGSVYINPAALGAIYAARYGEDELSPGNQRISAADLRVFTTRRSHSEQDESRFSADEYWDAHPELAAERHKHTRAAVERAAVAKGEAEVERFLLTQLNYQPTDANKTTMLNYLQSRSLPLTAESLMQAFKALKPTLAQSDKGVSYGSTTVVDFGPRRENPSYITKELKETTRRKVARMSSAQYAEWRLEHPNEVAIIDEE